MILWVLLFVLIVTISFVLALKSMRDFRDSTSFESSIFLIRKLAGLNLELLKSIEDDLSKSGLVLSFERLFKGTESALVVFGPVSLLAKYKDTLDLLELEDYTNVNKERVSAWEVSIRNSAKQEERKLFEAMPKLSQNEQFWWQLILTANKSSFKGFIRAVLIAETARRKSLMQSLQNLLPASLIKLPKAFSNAQLLASYKSRTFQRNSQQELKAEQVLKLFF